MRVANIDTLSSLVDRLIVENIKLWHFQSRAEPAAVLERQQAMLTALRGQLTVLFCEAFTGRYEYLGEQRTFSASLVADLLQQVEELTRAHLAISAAEHEKLRLVENELRSRQGNEGRARLKNSLDETLARLTGSPPAAPGRPPRE